MELIHLVGVVTGAMTPCAARSSIASISLGLRATAIHCHESAGHLDSLLWIRVASCSQLLLLFGTFHWIPRHLNQLLWLLWICISLWSGSFFHTLGIPYPWRDQILNFPDLFGQHLWNSVHSLSTEIHGFQEIRCRGANNHHYCEGNE